jgi:hypothetical protein
MTPIGSNTRPVYRDPKDRVSVGHPLEAAALLILGHAPTHVERGGQGRVTFCYGRDVAPIVQQLRRAADEVMALAERHRTSNPRYGAHTNVQPLR